MRELDRVRPDAHPIGHPIARRKHGRAAALMRELEHPTAELVEELQHSVGNRAVTRLLQRQPNAAPAQETGVEEVLDE